MQPPSQVDASRMGSDALAAKRPPRRYSPPDGTSDSTVVTEPVPIVRGTLIGDYRVERRLDEGGMGTVYSAVHPIIDKRVAIKVLHPHVARQEETVARFIQEARAVNAIGHPGIVDIFGFGRFVDGRHYITMEYLEGQQLLAFLNETGPISPLQMLPVARQLAESLAAAHDKGVLHRDMKPENVFLSVTSTSYKDSPWPPRTKILDFGLAKLIEAELEDARPHTRAGVTVGTPYYMSPEQCRGKAVDRRADLYALGVMMYEMITGRVPFYASESVDVLYMHLTQPPEPPSRHRPVPPQVEELILRCMAKNAQERLESMQMLIAELDRILAELCPDGAVRERPPEELQAEASAFFGGVEESSGIAEEPAEPSLSNRTTVPRLPESLGEALLEASQGAAGHDGLNRRSAVTREFEGAPTPVKTQAVSAGRPSPSWAPEGSLGLSAGRGGSQPTVEGSAGAPRPLASNQGALPSLPETPTEASSTPGSTARPSLPSPIPAERGLAVSESRTLQVPSESRQVAGADPQAEPQPAHAAAGAGATGDPQLGQGVALDRSLASAAPDPKAREASLVSSENGMEARHDLTDPVVVRPAPRRGESASRWPGGSTSLGSGLLWSLVVFQFIVIIVLFVLLWRR